MTLLPIMTEALVRAALLEDLGRAGDLTTDAIVPSDASGRARAVARSTGVVSGWTNFWGNMAGVAGPVLTAYLVEWTGSWSGALLGIAMSGIAGAVLWLFVHPERPVAALAGAAPI